MIDHMTKCPSCHTCFRVDEGILSASNGQVRCGPCQHVFNALEYLQPLSHAPTVTQEVPSEQESRLHLVSSWIRPETSALRSTDDWWQQVTVWVGPEGLSMSPPPPYDTLEEAVEKLRAQLASGLKSSIQHSTFLKKQYSEPEWVPKYDGLFQSRSTRLKLLRWVIYIWSILLLLQVFWLSRSVMAYHFPDMRPLLEEFSLAMGSVLFPVQRNEHWQIEQASLEKGTANQKESELNEKNPLNLKILLKQNNNSCIAWPDLMLKLSDQNDQPLVDQLFSPAEYLPYATLSNSDLKLKIETGLCGENEVHIQLALIVPENTVGFRVSIKP